MKHSRRPGLPRAVSTLCLCVCLGLVTGRIALAGKPLPETPAPQFPSPAEVQAPQPPAPALRPRLTRGFGGDMTTAVDSQVCRISRPSGPMCSATLISGKQLLTAGHCALDGEKSITGYKVECGSSVDPLTGEVKFTETRFIKKVRRHARYAHDKGTVENDTALVELDQPIDSIQPASIAVPSGVDPAHVACKMEGYGRDADNRAGNPGSAIVDASRAFASPTDRTLKYDQVVDVRSPAVINAANAALKNLDNPFAPVHLGDRVRAVMKAGGTLAWTFAPGDSGGPVLCDYHGQKFVVGVNSYMDKPDAERGQLTDDPRDPDHKTYPFQMVMDRSFIDFLPKPAPAPQPPAPVIASKWSVVCDSLKLGINARTATACGERMQKYFGQFACRAVEANCSPDPSSAAKFNCEMKSENCFAKTAAQCPAGMVPRHTGRANTAIVDFCQTSNQFAKDDINAWRKRWQQQAQPGR